MSQGASHYPIVQFISRLMREYGFSHVEFVQTLGYRHNAEKGVRRLNLWLETGEGHDRIIGEIAAVYPAYAEKLEKAVAETARLKAAEAEAAFLERCKAEEERFRGFIHADGEKTVPSGITIFGISGGHTVWTTIQIPKAILELPLEAQLTALPKLMVAYRRRYNGDCPFFGKLTGFKFVRLLDYFQFDVEGSLVEHVERPFRRGCVEVSLR